MALFSSMGGIKGLQKNLCQLMLRRKVGYVIAMSKNREANFFYLFWAFIYSWTKITCQDSGIGKSLWIDNC